MDNLDDDHPRSSRVGKKARIWFQSKELNPYRQIFVCINWVLRFEWAASFKILWSLAGENAIWQILEMCERPAWKDLKAFNADNSHRNIEISFFSIPPSLALFQDLLRKSLKTTLSRHRLHFTKSHGVINLYRTISHSVPAWFILWITARLGKRAA
jgi:hypothetical protein